MKIAIITFHIANNYGANLQVYALSKYLEMLGHNPIVIDYRPDYLDRIYRRPNWRKLGILYPLKWITCRRFDYFRNKNLKLTKRVFRSFEEITNNQESFDAYICGSDQIWNQEITGGTFDPCFFLSFAPKDINKISYAASFGKDKLPQDYVPLLKERLRDIDKISVREKSAVSIVEDVDGREATHVVDPTLLLNDYSDILSSRKINKKYVLFFRLQKEPFIYDVVSSLSNMLNLPVITITQNNKFWQEPGKVFLNPSPNRWLELFNGADYVITNSFHGTIFSVQFKKNFVVTPLTGNRAERNGRIEELLDVVGLKDRLLGADNLSNIHEIATSNIDWEEVSQSLSGYVRASKMFLEEAMKGE